MSISDTALENLEGLLVREFRTCQELYDLTKDERRAIILDDISLLLKISEQKNTLLDRLTQLENARLQWLALLGEDERSESLEIFLGSLLRGKLLDIELAQRFAHLQEGILTLMAQTRELTNGNRGLAASALQRSNNLQSYLLDLCQISDQFQIERFTPEKGQPANDTVDGSKKLLSAIFAAVVAARDALHNQDDAAADQAVGDLQNFLENVGRFLELSVAQQHQVQELIAQMQNSSFGAKTVKVLEDDTNLVELIAGLYHQETAYQAVLKSGERALGIA